MKNKRFKLYYISDNYIDYLRQFDNKIRFNKNNRRPYVGIVYTYNNFTYFAPLASPKQKHKYINKHAIDIWLIKDGELGVINFNNMIPAPMDELTEIIPTITDQKYKNLLSNQLSEINKNRYAILKKVCHFHHQYNHNRLDSNILKRCCDFRLLEQKCKDY